MTTTTTTTKLRKKTLPTLRMGTITATEKITFKEQPLKDSKYDPIYDRMEKLSPGQSFTIDIPSNVSPRTMHNRLNAAIHRVEVQAPKGCVFVKRTTNDNKIAISCKKVK